MRDSISTTTMSPFSATMPVGLDALNVGLQAKPTVLLAFYPFGIIMRRTTEDGGQTEHAVSPTQLRDVLTVVKVRLDTGLLTGNTLYIATDGSQKVIVEYRSPQRTSLFLEGSEAPVVIPLPGLVLARVSHPEGSLRYGIYAVKSRPESLDVPLFQPPLPNVGNGSICWGTVKRVSAEALAGNTLSEDWTLLLGSVFTSHSVHGKSKACPDDVRQHFIQLEKRNARKYPLSDLVPARLTLGEWLGKKS